MMTEELSLTDAARTSQEAVLTDKVANEVYSAHYAERRTSRFIIGFLSLALLGSMGTILSLARRPAVNRYVRIDEMGRAQAIQYSDLSYSPREAEVRAYLTDWVTYRYNITRDTISKKYPLNYYFLSQQVSVQLMADDNANRLVSQVLNGQVEQNEVDVRNVTITSMNEESVQGSRMARGTALINFDKIYSVRASREPRTEHWVVSATYYLNPKQVADESKLFPQFETINPLGLTVTEFHENRLGVTPLAEPGTQLAEHQAVGGNR